MELKRLDMDAIFEEARAEIKSGKNKKKKIKYEEYEEKIA